MGKMVARAWSIPGSGPFQDIPNSKAVLCLGSVGRKLDKEGYGYGRHGWEEFARDMGGVYNHHIRRQVVTAFFALSSICPHVETYAQAVLNLYRICEMAFFKM